MLLFEIVITRVFSILFFYHFSFFAITLVMSGLVLGGILAARWNAGSLSDASCHRRLSLLAVLFAAGLTLGLVVLVAFTRPDVDRVPSPAEVLLHALVFLPSLVAAGAFLALAFARHQRFIGTLYAWDLVAAALACVAAIYLLRAVQGPAVLLCPACLAGVAAMALGRGGFRLAGVGLVGLALALIAVDRGVHGALFRLRARHGTAPVPKPLLERWNEHSRVQAFERAYGRSLVIDRSAGTTMRHLPPRADGKPIEPTADWATGSQYQVYRLGRRVRDVAIIGVGGGGDLLPPVFHGARRIDGYELNGIFIELLEHTFRDYNALTTRPEIHLIHDEARVGITHSGRTYDVIQASMIDTWAATASGGFILSENSLYTLEAWHTFLAHLNADGVITMSRWLIPDAPAEIYRLVALAGEALARQGLPDGAARIMLVAEVVPGATLKAFSSWEATRATILVSKRPFTNEEVARIQQACVDQGLDFMLGPGHAPADPVLAELLTPTPRAAAIRASPFDIEPPRDTRPYFFLQVRPSDLVNLSRKSFGFVTQITFNGVRVVVILGICALLLVALVSLLITFSLPGAVTSAAQRREYRRMLCYFLGIGLGYMFVQVGLHQRLVIVLGHPTLALSVVLCAMLLGTGIGASLSARLFPDGSLLRAGAVIVATLLAVLAALPLVPALERVHASALRIGSVFLVLGGVGFVLGFAFPLGVRRVAGTGEWAVQKMWAVNGAASIAGSVLAALVGLAFGTPAVLATGVAAYALALAAGGARTHGATGTREPEAP
jgi:hypothetical protein